MRNRPLPFGPADILLPDLAPDSPEFTRWSCVACDQFTSEPAYWRGVADAAGDSPSAFRCILPEVYLGNGDGERAARADAAMERYLADGVFREYPGAMVYVERTLPDGAVRRGLVGAVDLESYDYRPGSKSPVRATEATVLERIPPRVAVRSGAPIELPHIMLLVDDPERTVIEPLSRSADSMKLLYDFDLMQGGGHIKGWLLGADEIARVSAAIAAKADALPEGGVLIAVGDGNHSLASAKECYRLNPTPRNRYALAELVNLHDGALVFEPIYRVVFGCEPAALLAAIRADLRPGAVRIEWRSASDCGSFTVDGLPADILQTRIDAAVAATPGAYCDYVHGVDSALALAASGDGVTAFLFDGMDKRERFPYVETRGSLPRKTFSMGEARSKRYYLEARKIDKIEV